MILRDILAHIVTTKLPEKATSNSTFSPYLMVRLSSANFCDHASKQKSHLKMHIVSVLYMKCLSAYNVILKPNQDTT